MSEPDVLRDFDDLVKGLQQPGPHDKWSAHAAFIRKQLADCAVLREALEKMTKEKERLIARGQEVAVSGAAGSIAATNETAASDSSEESGGYRFCAHGRTPLGSWCQQCNPFRR